MNTTKQTISLLGLVLLGSLVLAGCSSSLDSELPTETDQSVTLFSLQPEGQSAINLGFSHERGWHFEETATLQPLKVPVQTDEPILMGQSVVMQGGFPGGVNPGGSNSNGQNSSSSGHGGPDPSEFGSKIAEQSTSRFQTPTFSRGFVAGLTRGGFRIASSAKAFSGESRGSTGFSASTSSGGSCSLTSFCDFIGAMCIAFQGSGVEGLDQACGQSVGQCYSQVGRLGAEFPPEARGYLCRLSGFFTCLGNDYRRGVAGTDGFRVCASSAAEGLITLIEDQFDVGGGSGGTGNNNNNANPDPTGGFGGF